MFLHNLFKLLRMNIIFTVIRMMFTPKLEIYFMMPEHQLLKYNDISLWTVKQMLHFPPMIGKHLMQENLILKQKMSMPQSYLRGKLSEFFTTV